MHTECTNSSFLLKLRASYNVLGKVTKNINGVEKYASFREMEKRPVRMCTMYIERRFMHIAQAPTIQME